MYGSVIRLFFKFFLGGVFFAFFIRDGEWDWKGRERWFKLLRFGVRVWEMDEKG